MKRKEDDGNHGMAGEEAPLSKEEKEKEKEKEKERALSVKKTKMGGVSGKKLQSARRRNREIRRMRSDDVRTNRTRNQEESYDSFSDTSSSSSSSPPSSGSTRSSPSDSDADGVATIRIMTAGCEIDGGARDRVAELKNSTCAKCVSHGSVSLIGRRREMEDAVTVAPAFASPEAATYDFFGVYDGHGGARVAEACRERLHVVLAEEVAGEWSPEAAEERWREAMASSFSRVDGEVVATAGVRVEATDKTVGSTAVVAVVGPGRIVVANCGDSRAVLSRGGVAVPLSSDHKPDRPDEMQRVEAAGGRVINWDGYRVLGVLATSRSIGDYYLKPFVTSEPEVTVTDRTDRDEFLILASDGLWDVVSNEVACRITRQCLTGRAAKMFPKEVKGRTATEAATLLAKVAMSRGSKDNISIVVVELKRLGGGGGGGTRRF